MTQQGFEQEEERGTSGSCVVPSDLEGQTAGQAAGVPFNGPASHCPQRNQYFLNWPRAFFFVCLVWCVAQGETAWR